MNRWAIVCGGVGSFPEVGKNQPIPVRTVESRYRLVAFALLLLASTVVHGANEGEFKGVLRTEAANRPPLETRFWASAERLRMDVSQPIDMTVVWSFGADTSLRMIRHDERAYVEWGPKQLENARQMVRRANRKASQAIVDSLRFEKTGARTTLEGWDTFEVRLLSENASSHLWVTQDIEFGLARFFAHYARALHETTRFPMIGTDNDPLGLNNGTSLPLDQLGNAIGLQGRVVRIVDNVREPSNSTTISLHSLEPGPFKENFFAVPDGYTRKAQLTSGVQ